MITSSTHNPFQTRWDLMLWDPLDWHFARFIVELAGIEDDSLFLAAALVSQHTRQGHVCLDLATVAGKPLEGAKQRDHAPISPELTDWRTRLESTRVVGAPGDHCPLILDQQSRLYLFRYWEYERDLETFIKERAPMDIQGIDLEILEQGLERHFLQSLTAHNQSDWQRIAARTALTRRFCVITGGPGTGKTTTVARILALLREQPDGRGRRIALAAPTGKAAARLEEAIRAACTRLQCPQEIRSTIPTQAATIHRLLGSLPNSPYFRHDAANPLDVDMVIVDEASMVDLALMAKLVRALPPRASLILLGDKDQLASVEAGAVLGDICDGGPSPPGGKSPQPVGDASRNLPRDSGTSELADSIVELRESFRFPLHSGIARMGRAVRAGHGDAAVAVLRASDGVDLEWGGVPTRKTLVEALKPLVLRGFSSFLEASTVEDRFAAFERFRILCALRRGPYGVAAVNTVVEQILRDAGLIELREWYCGRPLLITQNDYNLKLFNGDVGLVLPEDHPLGAGSPELSLAPCTPTSVSASRAGRPPRAQTEFVSISPELSPTSAMRVFFQVNGGVPRKLLPARLPTHETVFAMTVHKSQGSEFDDVLLLLPDRDSPVLTRELIYTAITRARRKVTLWAGEDILRIAVAKRVHRSSGLRDALWGGQGDRSCQPEDES